MKKSIPWLISLVLVIWGDFEDDSPPAKRYQTLSQARLIDVTWHRQIDYWPNALLNSEIESVPWA
jgi:hypothetical protein